MSSRLGIGIYALNHHISEQNWKINRLESALASIIEEIEMDYTPEQIASNQLLRAIHTHAKSGLK